MSEHLTIEQQRALARARARARAEARQEPQVPSKPVPDPIEPESIPLVAQGPFGRRTERLRQEGALLREEIPLIPRVVLESSPAMAGTIYGAKLGARAGPWGMLLGAMGGGLIGEFTGQTLGLAPESDVMLGVSGTAPGAGRVVMGAGRLAGRAMGGTTGRIPAAIAARARTTEQAAMQQFEKLAEKVLASQRGLLTRSADDLFQALRRHDINIPVDQFRNTFTSLDVLRTELAPLVAFPEARTAMRIIDQVTKTLAEGGEVALTTIVGARQQIGRLIPRLEKTGGVKLGTVKSAFKAISDDLDRMVKPAFKITAAGKRVQIKVSRKRAIEIAKAANSRFKIEQSVRELEEALIKFSETVPGKDAVALNVKNLRNWLREATNPKSAKFDKNFKDGLGDVLPEIMERLTRLSKITAVSKSAAGPGSIVVRGITAGGGGLIGEAVAGAPGAVLGAFLGATGPDALMAALMTRRGARLLEAALRAGRGTIDMQRLVLISQAATQATMRPGRGVGVKPIPAGVF